MVTLSVIDLIVQCDHMTFDHVMFDRMTFDHVTFDHVTYDHVIMQSVLCWVEEYSALYCCD